MNQTTTSISVIGKLLQLWGEETKEPEQQAWK